MYRSASSASLIEIKSKAPRRCLVLEPSQRSEFFLMQIACSPGLGGLDPSAALALRSVRLPAGSGLQQKRIFGKEEKEDFGLLASYLE